MHEEDAGVDRECAGELKKPARRHEVSVRLRLADGAYHHFEVQCSRIEDKRGKVIVWSGPLAEQSLAEMPTANRFENAKRQNSLLANPGLGPSKERYADVAADCGFAAGFE